MRFYRRAACVLAFATWAAVADTPKSPGISSELRAAESLLVPPDAVPGPAGKIKGIVVDTAGKPVPGAHIRAAHSQEQRYPIVSDESGQFELTDLRVDDETALRAQTATATTEGAISVKVRDVREPIKLIVREANAFRVSGGIVDPDNRPLSGAKVRIEWQIRGAGRASRFSFGVWGETLQTDAAGRFASSALVPGDEYRLRVDAPGFGSQETALVLAAAGRTYDFGLLRLPRADGRVAGIVVDRQNRPIEGARVINSGDGPKPIDAVTGPDGRFELVGFYEGPVWLCAQKTGRRWTSLRSTSGDHDAKIVLLSIDEPLPEPRVVSNAAALADSRKKLTRHLLDALWALPDDKLEGFRRQVLEGMARFDLPEAHRWFDERKRRGVGDTGDGSALSRVLTIADAENIAETDADEAIGLLAPLSAGDAQRTLVEIARRLPPSDRRRALRVAEEAVLKSRAMPLPNRAWAMAEGGELLTQLGERDAGRKLILESADLAEQLGAQRLHSYGRGMVAVRLAPFDFNRARNLVPAAGDNEHNRWLAALAVRIAPDNLDRAMEIIRSLKSESSLKPDASGRVALGLARAGRTTEAIKLAKSIESPFRPLSAVAAVAEVVGQTDRAQARLLIDDALDRYWNEPERLMPYSRSYRPLNMAQIGWHARQAHHPDLDEVVARIMACRATAPHDDSPDNVAHQLAQTAMLLSFIDPSAAEWLIDRATTMRPSRQGGRLENQRDWQIAIALADPKRAIGDIDRAIAVAKSSPQGVQSTGLIGLMSILTQPTEVERRRQLLIHGGVHWPSDED